ncbi:MAG: hypothetical protein JW953_18910 [Anaerolineae bacterium]|nr:hypothetical protein [Anaerolineae bacterium]
MKRGLLIIGIVFIVTLTIVFGMRVSPDAMAVVIGVILGVAAGVPTTLLLVFVLTRQQNRLEKLPSQMPAQPPVFVINAGDKPPAYSPPPALPAPHATENGRKWTIIGDTAEN